MKNPAKRPPPEQPERDLGPRVEALYQQMQRPDVRDATERALQANPEDMGAAAVRAATRKA